MKGSKSKSCKIIFFLNSRITFCKFNQIGCPWRGPNHEYLEHEKVCVHPNKTGAEVMEALKLLEQKSEEEKKLYDGIFELLSFEKIAINGKHNVYVIFLMIAKFCFHF